MRAAASVLVEPHRRYCQRPFSSLLCFVLPRRFRALSFIKLPFFRPVVNPGGKDFFRILHSDENLTHFAADLPFDADPRRCESAPFHAFCRIAPRRAGAKPSAKYRPRTGEQGREAIPRQAGNRCRPARGEQGRTPAHADRTACGRRSVPRTRPCTRKADRAAKPRARSVHAYFGFTAPRSSRASRSPPTGRSGKRRRGRGRRGRSRRGPSRPRSCGRGRAGYSR